MSSALNGSFVIWCFEGSNAIDIPNGITFDFYTGLPHMRSIEKQEVKMKAHSNV